MTRHTARPAATHYPGTVSQTDLLLDCASAASYWLLNRFYQEHETAPGDPSWRAALRILEARAHCHCAPPLPAHRRVAARGNALEIAGLDGAVTPHPQKMPSPRHPVTLSHYFRRLCAPRLRLRYILNLRLITSHSRGQSKCLSSKALW